MRSHCCVVQFNLSVILAFVLDERMSPIPGEGTRRMGVKNLSVTLSFENETESKIRDSLLVVVQRRTDTIRSAGCRKQYDQWEEDKKTCQKYRREIPHNASL